MRNIVIATLFAGLSAVANLHAQPATPAAPSQDLPYATVGGQVRKPGPVVVNKDTTLYSIVQAAGGPTEFGAERRVKIIRKGQVSIYNLKDDAQKMTKVLPSDTIDVPQKNLFGR